MYFPYGGILGQSAEAKACRLNATIGMAFEEDGSPLVMECFSRNLNVGKKAFLYAGSFGNPDLRRIWKEKQIEKNPSLKGIKFSLPVVTNAITHSLRVAAELFSDESATLVVPDLYWDNYDLVFVESTGCGKRMFNTFKNGSFDSAAMKEALLSEGEKKILILNFPNNPTGYTATLEDAAKIVSAVKSAAQKGKKVTVVLDDAYFGLVYEKGIHCESLFSEFAGLHKNVLAVKVDGLTKEDYAWGLRVGFISFAFKGATDRQLAALEAKAAGSVRGSISNVTSVGQALAVEAFGDRKYRAQKREKYNILKRRYDEIRRIFSKRDFSAQFEPMPFNSGYFMCIKPNGVDPEELRRHLIEKYSLGTIVLSGLVRLAFSTVPRASLKKMFHDIASAVDDLKKR
jgi:aspartate/methionine/tyrosine aminotransferase